MKRYRYLSLLIILLIVFVMISQGCSGPTVGANAMQSGKQQTKVNQDDLAMVNEYLKGIGSKEIPLDAAEVMNDSINENTQTQEIKSDWQLLVDYISNEESVQPAALTYSIEFKYDTFSVRMDKVWENIGG